MSINANDLRPFPRLLYLNLWQNQLISIDGDLFTYTPLLKRVDFNNNKIQHIKHDLLINLYDLEYLGFLNNICINQSAQNRAEVLLLAPQLSVLCPQLAVTTTISTTATKAITTTETTTTTDRKIDQCMCDEEIRALGSQVDSMKVLNIVQSEEIEQLQHSKEQLIQENAEFEKRLLEIEMKLLEIGSLPCSN